MFRSLLILFSFLLCSIAQANSYKGCQLTQIWVDSRIKDGDVEVFFEPKCILGFESFRVIGNSHHSISFTFFADKRFKWSSLFADGRLYTFQLIFPRSCKTGRFLKSLWLTNPEYKCIGTQSFVDGRINVSFERIRRKTNPAHYKY